MIIINYMKRTILLSSLALLFAMGSMAQDDAQMVVSTESGLVKGFNHEGSMGFLGIRHAKVTEVENDGYQRGFCRADTEYA